MVLSPVKTEPSYSIGKYHRPPVFPLSDTPGPIYPQTRVSNLKFAKPPSYSIGDAKRPPLYENEIFNYYKFPYDKSSDLSAIPKRWDTIKGGACTLEPRMRYDFTEGVPGPGRYDPDYKNKSQTIRAPTHVLCFKSNKHCLDLITGTGDTVAPWTYKQDMDIKLSKHRQFPKYSFQMGERKGLEDKVWTKNESYYVYSAFGNQIMTRKPTEPIQSMTKSTRDGRLKCGIFKSMMERQPQQVRIPMPKL